MGKGFGLSDSQSIAVQDVVQLFNYGIDEVGPVPQEEDYRIVVLQSPVSLSAACEKCNPGIKR